MSIPTVSQAKFITDAGYCVHHVQLLFHSFPQIYQKQNKIRRPRNPDEKQKIHLGGKKLFVTAVLSWIFV
jgi:hypothetical protein